MHFSRLIYFLSLVLSYKSLSTALPTPADELEPLIESPFVDPPDQNVTISARAPYIPAWHFYADATHSTHQQKFDQLAPAGWRMISLSVYGSPAKYAAIWVKRAGPGYAAIHGATAAQYQKWFNDWSAKGLVSTIVTVTGPANSPVYAGVMEAIQVASWFQRCGMTKADFETQNQLRREASMALKSFREYGTSGDRRYCGLWHGNGGFEKWSAHITQSYSEYQLSVNAEIQKRYWRPAYVTASEDNYITSFFTDTSIGPWIARHGLTSAQLDSEYKTHMANYFYPIQIQGSGNGANTRFTALFAQQDTPTPRTWTANGPGATGFKNNAAAIQTVDTHMQAWMAANGVRQAQVAIGKKGSILLERAYTWAEPDRHRTTTTDRFLLASVSKMFVAGAIQHLYNAGKLKASTEVYPLLGYKNPTDSRVSKITIDNLINHAGGYDRTVSGDPIVMFREIAKARGGSAPASMKDVVDYMFKKKLDFDPGAKYAYSNYGYMLLSYVVEKVSGVSYYTYLKNNVLGGLDVVPYATAGSAHVTDPIFQEGAWLGPDAANPTSDLLVPGQYGGDGLYKESSNGPSAMSCSATSLARYIYTHGERFIIRLLFELKVLTYIALAVRGIGGRAANNWHDGVMSGSRTFDQSRSDGIDWAVVLNTADFPNGDNFWGLVNGRINAYLDTNPTV
jgi:CubicO group peptidase (beta-lactamase class C family)